VSLWTGVHERKRAAKGRRPAAKRRGGVAEEVEQHCIPPARTPQAVAPGGLMFP